MIKSILLAVILGVTAYFLLLGSHGSLLIGRSNGNLSERRSAQAKNTNGFLEFKGETK